MTENYETFTIKQKVFETWGSAKITQILYQRHDRSLEGTRKKYIDDVSVDINKQGSLNNYN